MERDICDQIAALPAKKILMYHNIAPPDFLAEASALTRNSKLQRAQLDVQRDSVATALGSAKYNAIEPGNESFPDRAKDAARDMFVRQQQPVRIAWVSTWDVRCGIAEHSMSLLQPLIDRPDSMLADLTILCDDRTPPSKLSEWLRIAPCWNGVDPGTERLCRAVAAADADVVVIQHQPGLIKWEALVELLNDPRVRRRTVVVALHATRRILDLELAEREAILEALSGVSRVLVHRAADVNLLKLHGLDPNVVLFPLGADAQYCVPVVRPLAEEDKIVIGCYGFFLPGKGIDRLI
jgi:glycosyltransferase involved in cell wall biosynthesis